MLNQSTCRPISESVIVEACIAGVVREQIWWQIWIQHVDEHLCKFLEQLRQPVTFDSIFYFSLDDMCDVITIVAMFTIVAINHNCRNTNRNCR